MRKLFYFVFALTLTVFAVSCQSDEEVPSVQDEHIDEFTNAYNTSMPDLFAIGVRPSFGGNGPRKSGPVSIDSTQTVYVKPGSGIGNVGDLKPFTGTTLRDFAQYLELAGATASMFNDGTAIDSANISVAEAKEKLAPMVKESRKYLKSKGFTDKEIENMLSENGAVEEELVPLVLCLRDYEENSNKGFYSAPKPGGKEDLSQQSYLELKKAAGCALKVIGFDILEELMNSGTTKITKKFIIKIFKKVVSRYLGVIGAALAVIDWGECMGYY